MARAVAGYDYEKARAIGVWPVVELLESYEAIAIQRATDEHRHATLVWTTRFPSVFVKGKPPKPPELPLMLRKRGDG